MSDDDSDFDLNFLEDYTEEIQDIYPRVTKADTRAAYDRLRERGVQLSVGSLMAAVEEMFPHKL